MTDFVVYVCPECGQTQKHVYTIAKQQTVPHCMAHTVIAPVMVQCWPVTKTEEKNSEEEQKRNQVLSLFKGYAKALAYQDGIELAFIMETIRDYLKREKE